MIESHHTIALFEFASGTYKSRITPDKKLRRLPAAWKITIENNKVKGWQVFYDSKIPSIS